MKACSAAMLARAFVMDLPTWYMGEVQNGFGRYVRRLERTFEVNGWDVKTALKKSLKEHSAMTMDGRFYGK